MRENKDGGEWKQRLSEMEEQEFEIWRGLSELGLYAVEVWFLQQKTAYEMRISDWSSDVCSSDLLRIAGPQQAAAFGRIGLAGQRRQGGAPGAAAHHTDMTDADMSGRRRHALAPAKGFAAASGSSGQRARAGASRVSPSPRRKRSSPAQALIAPLRSEESRAGKEGGRSFDSRGPPYHAKNN